ncbi:MULTISPECIES: RNA methyltransferase [unclassified Micromonospora]|uniref:TrmH family RNA methyltransferase n=1 Tax=unclassified Micromonospora TaxID=2617518 RepID=UPI00188ED833|nr:MULTISPECIES: RNA methyltransferase [unclassified Micromonospora]MBF5033208.1 RNA methyltransferase [Micromonospora sp. ANENR4]MCZ7474571.1 RNA methyltransferase [Micromonospora sp. WMMC273]WBC05209.1 RNA methyltransferase [Micromonospora sp. WMMA1976]
MQSRSQGRRLDAVPGPFTPRTPRVVAARRLQRRRDRDQAGRFLAEGPQAVREALARTGTVVELFGTPAALDRYADLAAAAARADVPVSEVTDDALAALAETVAPQGLVAVCRHLDVPLEQAVARAPRLVAVLAGIRDPGNAGTVLRTADAAGAGAVVFAGEAVDPYNGKCVRASAGSLFHVDVVRAADPLAAVEALRAGGLTIFATTGYGDSDLDDLADSGRLAAPTAWLFGSEAHGLPEELTGAADARVRVPLHGRAESLNLAAAAAVCLYSSARALRVPRGTRETAGESASS